MRVSAVLGALAICCLNRAETLVLPTGDCAPALLAALERNRDSGGDVLDVYPNPAVKYPVLDTMMVLRPAAGQDRAQIDVRFHLPYYGFTVRHKGSAFRTINLKQSRIEGFNLTLPADQDGLIGHDQAGEDGKGSSTYVTWERCHVQLGGKNQIGFRNGSGGDDFCLNRYVSCSVTGSSIGAGQDRINATALRGCIGWSVVGANNLNEYWESCGASDLAYGWQLDADPTHLDARGGGSASVIVNASVSWCGTAFHVEGGYDVEISGRVEESGVGLMIGRPFEYGAARSRVDARLTLAAMLPDNNRALGIGENGEVVGVHSSSRVRLSLRAYGWTATNPIVLMSAGTGASLDLSSSFLGWDPATLGKATRGTWATRTAAP